MPVKIVHTITKLELGGAQTTTLYTLNNLPDNYEGYLFSGEGGILYKNEAWESLGCKVEFCQHLKRKIRLFADIRALNDMVKYFKKIQPDIVHSHSSKAGILSRWAAKKAGVPIVIHTFHGFGFTPLQPWYARNFFIWLEKKAAKISTKLIFVSQANREKALNLKIGREDQYEVIRSGIDIEEYKKNKGSHFFKGIDLQTIDNKSVRLNDNTKIVGNVSCFKPQKALQDYIEACRRLKEKDKEGSYKFILVGDGKLHNKLEKLVKKAGLEDCFFMLGWRLDVEKIIPGFDVMLHTSRFEGLSKVFLQAMAADVPIVATNVDGAMDVIEHNVNGYLVAPGDIDAIVKYSYELLEDENLRKKMGEAGRMKLKPEFDLKNMSNMTNDLYEKLIKEAK